MSSRAKSRDEGLPLANLPVSRSTPLVKTYYVYMLRCAEGSFYVGITNDIELRVAQHQYGIDPRCYTFERRPVTLVYSSDFRNVDDAIAWEKQLKRWSHAKKAALITSDWARIHRLAECTNATAAKLRGASSLAPRRSLP